MPVQLLCSPQHCGLTDSYRRTGQRSPDIQSLTVAQSVICCCMVDNETLGCSCFGGCRTPFMRGGEAAVSKVDRGPSVSRAYGGGSTKLCFAAWSGAQHRHLRPGKAGGKG